MMTKWFNQALLACVTGQTTSVKNYAGTYKTLARCVDYKYQQYLWFFFYIPAFISSVSTTSNSQGVWFGDGTTPPTADDYKLSGTKITTISVTVKTDTPTSAGDPYTMTYTITNTGDSDITISEVGLFGNAQTVTSSADYNNQVLIDRTLLDEPVTIPSGGVGQVVYSVTLS